MLAEFHFSPIPILSMSNSDLNDAELENSAAPTSIPPIGSSIIPSILNTPKLENRDCVSLSIGEVIGDEIDRNDDGFRNSPIPTSNYPIGSPITGSISNTPKLENQGSVSRSTGEEKKRRRIGDETDLNDDGLENLPIPTSKYPIGSPITGLISNTPKLENQCSVSRSTEGDKKRRRLGDEIDQSDDGFKTPTDSDHRIPVPAQCPPAPRKPSSRKSKSPPATVTETRRSLFPMDVSDDEAESFFPRRVEDEVGPTKVKRRRRDDDVA